MAFGNLFDGYCVIHAPFAAAHRMPPLRAELSRVGVKDFQIIEANKISPNDPRVAAFGEGATVLVSIIEAYQSFIRHAQKSRWKSAVFMEDDVIFRRNFDRLWGEVEEEIISTNWGLLMPYRWPTSPDVLVQESIFGKTTLVPESGSHVGHCQLIRADFYEPILEQLDRCMKNGEPADYIFGRLSWFYPNRVLSTTRNLVGQRGGLESNTAKHFTRGTSFYSSFRAARSPIEYAIVSKAHHVYSSFRTKLRRAK